MQVSLCSVEAKRRFSVDAKAVPLLNVDSFYRIESKEYGADTF